MDDLKLFGKRESQMESLVNTVHTMSKDLDLRMGLQKCGVLVLELRWLDLPNRKIINEVGKGGYRHLRILDLNKVLKR
ncbi:unnamed protein product [Porites lobata]|uniref:Uncharacterized protein n=1 Tax=Porites lobata TaxID=104759 RepID=A0ABN8PDU2_9CNID|nr:unnamed protein product [Porites lobata]